MHSSSYLLLLDGSVESLCAAQMCRQLADSTGARVTALSIIDKGAILNLVRPGRPGLIGSGPQIAARDQIEKEMSDLFETVHHAYKAKFPSLIRDENSTAIVEGDPIDVVRTFYDSHDLIIMGRRTPTAPLQNGFSLSEMVAADGVRPVLIALREMDRCAQLRLVAGSQVPDLACIGDVLNLATSAHLSTQFSYFGPSQEFDAWSYMLADSIPASATSVHFTDVQHPLQLWKNQMSVGTDSLTVFFTKKNPVGRSSIGDADITSLLLDLRVPAALLWPVEFKTAA